MPGRGETFVVAAKALRDERTGREFRQVSPEGSRNVAAYMYVNSFSPDERYLFYGSDRSGAWEIHRLEIETGRTTQMTEIRSRHAPRWNCHPDGREVFLFDGEAYRAVDVETLEERVVIDLRGQPWLRRPGGTPMFSASGKSFCQFFQVDRGRRGIALVACDGSGAEHVHTHHELMLHLMFCPANENVLTFCTWPDSQDDMALPDEERARTWIVDVSTGESRPYLMMQKGFRATHEYWSASGGRLYFHKKTQPGWLPASLCYVDRETEAITEFFRSETVMLGHSFVTRDDRLAVSDSQRPDENELLLVEVDSGEVEVLCWPNSRNRENRRGLAGNHVHPSFSPSGRYVVFTSDRTGEPHVYLVPLG
jgi:dipeptidyl aminopeptidase/acylaminoacyl peptidase